MMETEYVPPGHPPLYDIELDIDALKLQWKDREEVIEAPIGNVPPKRKAHVHSGHQH